MVDAEWWSRRSGIVIGFLQVTAIEKLTWRSSGCGADRRSCIAEQFTKAGPVLWKRNCRVNVLAGELATQGETAFRDRDARVLERASEVSVWNAAPNTDEPSKHQYVHLGNDEGARLAFSQVQDWTATSWKLDDPRVEAATMRVWLKNQQCTLLHITLEHELEGPQRTLALRLARLQRRASRCYLIACPAVNKEVLSEFLKDEPVRTLTEGTWLLVTSTPELLQPNFFVCQDVCVRFVASEVWRVCPACKTEKCLVEWMMAEDPLTTTASSSFENGNARGRKQRR